MKKLAQHGISKRELKVYLITMIFLVIGMVLAKRAIEILVEDYLPAQYYLQYNKIETMNWAYPAGKEWIDVLSYSEIKKDNLYINWDDELHCTPDDIN